MSKPLVVILIVLGLISVVGFIVFHESNMENRFTKPRISPTITGMTYGKTIDTLGWKTHTLPNEKLKFKYPPNWTLTQNNKENDPTRPTETDIISPNNFVLSFTTGENGLGGGCPSSCQSTNIKNVVLKTLLFHTKPLYVVVNGIKKDNQFGDPPPIEFNVIPRKECYYNICYGFVGKNTKRDLIIKGKYVDTSGHISFMPTDQFINSTDVKTAVSVLETVTY